uniref:Small ribosomal subunit protein uS4c n=1 Tax=Fritschiella tuberosa TaxID=56004 RepID=A0A6H1YD05_9CHLO|nr:ribosomal protein S4 [Fritschiella tuberosa]
MSRYLGPRLRVTRRLGHLSGLTRKKPPFKPLNPVNPFGPKKIIPPGQHGRNKSFKKKPYESCEYDYLIRLKLKQRLRYHYGLTEKQLVRYVQQAKKIKGSTGRVLLRLLEMRLDNIVFRLHMAPTIKAARQLISHGHILVNKKKVTIPSYQCEPKDIITVAPKIISMELVSRFLNEFDREKSRYERLLKILEFGRKGTTMSLKNQKNVLTTKKSIINKTQKFNNVQSLKIGSILNVKINNKGRNEAEAISYAFGKMIVIHPYFVGRQSINKNISVVIYKKSRNNKILYTYPANPFYLHLENLRKLNALDIAKIFNNSMTKNSIVKKQTMGKSSGALASKVSKSALIVMNGTKLLGGAKLSVAKRKTRVNQNSTDINAENKKEFSPSIFVRIIAAKCLNKKAKQKLLNISNLKTLSPSFTKDPVAYREKYVYTKTSRALRLFGTRFYAKILKNKNDLSPKNLTGSKFGAKGADRRRTVSTASTVPSNIKNTVNKTKVNFLNKQNIIKPESKANAFLSPVTRLKEVEAAKSGLSAIKNIPFTKASLAQQSNRNISTISNFLGNTMKSDYNLNLFDKPSKNVPLFVTHYKNSITKMANVSLQSQPNLTAKILKNFLYESKNSSLNLNSFHDFIFVVFSKFSTELSASTEKNATIKNENILGISKNFNTFFKNTNFETNLMESNKFSFDLFVLTLKFKQLTKLIHQVNHSSKSGSSSTYRNELDLDLSLLTNTIQRNISLSLMLDKIKYTVQNTVKFVSSFFSTDVLVTTISPYFNNLFSFIFKTEKMIKDILVSIRNTIKTLLMLSKVTSLNTNINQNMFHQFLHNSEKKTNRLYKKCITFSMESIQKAGLLEALGSDFLYVATNKLTYAEYIQQKTNFLEKYTLYSSKNQNVEMVKTLNYLIKYNLIAHSKTDSINQSINHKMHHIEIIIAYLKQQTVDQAKFNFLNSKLAQQKHLADQKIWFEQLTQTFEQKLVKKQLKSKAMLGEILQFNLMAKRGNLKLNLTNSHEKIVSKVNRLKDLNLIKYTNYNVVKNLLNSSFNTLQILQSFGSTIYFSKSNLLNSIMVKTVNQISQLVATNSSVLKVPYLSEKNQLKGTITIDSFNQIILKSSSFGKMNFIKRVLFQISQNTDLANFFNPVLDNTNKDFNFMSQLNQIICLDKLNKFNLLDAKIGIQLFAQISEKLAVKQLNQTNIVLASYLAKNTKNVSDVLYLDTFSRNAALPLSNSSNTNKKESFSEAFWKKLSISITPNLLKKGLSNLQQLNFLSGDKYSYLIVKLQHLYTQYKKLGLKGNKKYLSEKFVILKTLLSFVSRNLTLSAFSRLNLFNQSNNWANQILLSLGLQKQKQMKTFGLLLNKEKTNYILNIQKLASSSELTNLGFFSTFIHNYIERQYNSLYNQILIPTNLDTSLSLHSEKTKVLNSIKLYLLRYKFIVDNQQMIYTSNSRVLALKKQTSILIDKTMYQNLKNCLNEILSMNLQSLIQSKDFIVVYLMKELTAKLTYKLDLQSNSNLLTDTQIQQFNNTFILLTSPDALVNFSLNLRLPQTNVSYQTYLTQKIVKLSKSSNLFGPYSFLYDNSLVLDTKLDKVYFFDVLQKFKIELNQTKLNVLLSNYNEQTEIFEKRNVLSLVSQKNSLNLKLYAALYKTLTNLCLVEKAASLNKDFILNSESLIPTKQVFLNEFNQTLSYVIYISNLNLLKNNDILSEQTYDQFKNNYETIFKVVKKEAMVVSELNKRKKWKFINYATYQTLFKTISENLTTKILSLLQFSQKEKGLERNVVREHPFSQNSSLQQQSNYSSQSSSSLQQLIQQTLEQLVNASESTPTNFTSFIYGFVQKTSLMNNFGLARLQPSILSAFSEQLLTDLNKQSIKQSLKNLIAIDKKFQALGLNPNMKYLDQKGSKEKTLLQNKQKLIILQSFILNFQTQDHATFGFDAANLFTLSNKYKQIVMIDDFALTHRQNSLKGISNYQHLSKETNVDYKLLSQLENVQFNLNKEYGNKLTSNLLKLETENPALASLTTYKQSIFGALQKTAMIESYSKQNATIEKNLSKFQTTQFVQNILLHKLVSSPSQLKLMKLNSSDLFTYIFTVMPFKNGSNSEFQSFISEANLQKLVSSGILSSTMVNTIQKKQHLQVKTQNFRKIANLIKILQKLNYLSLTKFNKVVYYTTLIKFFACLSELKQAKAISERKYAAIKQKVKVFSLFTNLNYKLLAVTETSVNPQLKQQLLQKLLQKLKQSKTVTQFKQSFQSVSSLRKDLARVTTSKSQSTKFGDLLPSVRSNILAKLLKSRGRWAKVSVKQLATQKLITTKQQEKLNTIIDNQNLIKMKKLRHLILVFDYCRNILQSQPNNLYTNANTQLLQEVITSVLKSFTGPWRNVLVNLLYKNNFISKHVVVKYLTTAQNGEIIKRRSATTDGVVKLEKVSFPKTKLHTLLSIYFRQFKSLITAQKNRTISKPEFEQKLSSILSNVLVILERGEFTAFKIVHNSKWINQLSKNSFGGVGATKKTQSNKVSSAIRDFITNYNLLKDKYLPIYKKYRLNEKLKLFKVYKNSLLQELVTLQQNGQNFEKKSQQSPTNETTLILNTTRLEQFKAQGLISSKTYKKLKSTLNSSLQRLIKVDKLFALQNLYALTDDSKLSIQNSNSTADSAYESNSVKVQFQFESNVKKTRDQYINLTYKIMLSYLKSEYKQIEKTLIKQKLLLQRFENSKLKQKRTKQLRNFNNSKFASSEQFNNFFKQLLNFLDSRYKSGGRNRRNPRINTIIRRLNQQLSFDKTLTQKFGEHLQTFIDKRFGPALPLPPHLELKRWKIKTSKLQSKQKSNLKYLILPVGIVRDLAPRRSVGLPILERFIIEYYSRK